VDTRRGRLRQYRQERFDFLLFCHAGILLAGLIAANVFLGKSTSDIIDIIWLETTSDSMEVAAAHMDIPSLSTVINIPTSTSRLSTISEIVILIFSSTLVIFPSFCGYLPRFVGRTNSGRTHKHNGRTMIIRLGNAARKGTHLSGFYFLNHNDTVIHPFAGTGSNSSF
jgi:hypothetical protein